MLFLGVATEDGPHVTPIVFDDTDDRLWLVAPRKSAKVRAIRANDRVGGLIRGKEHDLLIGGRATVVDPLAGRGLSPGMVLELPFAAVGYLTRNQRHVSGVVRDSEAPAALPVSRVLIRVDVKRAALVSGDRVLDTWGKWGGRSVLLPGALDPAPPSLRGLPARLHPYLLQDTENAVLGWAGPKGPAVLPARWHASGSVEVGAEVLSLSGALPAGRASVTVETSKTRLNNKRGVLLIGPARARGGEATAQVVVAPRRLSWWRGAEAGTIRS
ncbi:MAG: hypothetical protein ACT4QG_14715 [Sporichthyaceae bacterium]